MKKSTKQKIIKITPWTTQKSIKVPTKIANTCGVTKVDVGGEIRQGHVRRSGSCFLQKLFNLQDLKTFQGDVHFFNSYES